MKTSKLLPGLTAFFLLFSAQAAKSDVSVGLSADSDGLKSFYLSIGEHYRVPEKEVIVIRERKIPDEELPVVFFIARHASIEPSLVVKLRLEGKSWFEISAHYGLSPSIYYVAFEKDPGPPYGKAWGHYKNKKKSEWNTIKLTDAEVVNCVNVKFMSEHYGYSPDEVVKFSEKGQNVVAFNTKVKNHKEGKNKQSGEKSQKGNDKGKGKKGK